MTKRSVLCATFAIALFAASASAVRSESPAAAVTKRIAFAQGSGAAFLRKYCIACHSGAKAEGEVQLDSLLAADWAEQHSTWVKVIEQIESRNMPPAKKPAPAGDEVDAFLSELRPALKESLLASNRVPPPAALRRLNRVQYRNVVRDLLGVDIDPTLHLPADETGFGFDNVGETLTISPILMEQYLRMAKEIATAVVVTDPDDAAPIVASLQWPEDRIKGKGPSRYSGEKLTQPFSHAFEIPADDEYVLKLLTLGENIGAAPLVLAVDVDGSEAFRVDVSTTSFVWSKQRVQLSKGTRTLTFRAVLPTPDPKATTKPPPRGPILLERVTIGRPSQTTDETYPEPHRRVMIARPSEKISARQAAAAIFRPLAARAYRRPATNEEVDRLATIVEQEASAGAAFDQSVQLGIQAMLCSPNFLYLGESERGAGPARTIDEYELASRLSFFLWNTMPDAELFAAASEGRLRSDLDQQVKRMIADPRFEEFCRSFTHQWLKLTRLAEFRPDPQEQQYAKFELIRDSALRETPLFFAAIVRDDLSLLTLIDADFSYMDYALAEFYGLNPRVPKEQGFQRVSTQSIRRGGILTHASVLAATSYPTRTSPVLRGAWILENLLNAPTPAAPPDVPSLEQSNVANDAATLSVRKQLEQHRSVAACAVCHNRIDPLGFALEAYNIIGRTRTLDDSKQPVDTKAVLPTGEEIDGVSGLKQVLLNGKREQFLNCLTEKMMIYALGRGLDPADVRVIQEIHDELAASDAKAQILIRRIVHCEAFDKK